MRCIRRKLFHLILPRQIVYLKFDAVKIWCTRYEEYVSKPYREYDGKNTRDLILNRVKTFSECLKR